MNEWLTLMQVRLWQHGVLKGSYWDSDISVEVLAKTDSLVFHPTCCWCVRLPVSLTWKRERGRDGQTGGGRATEEITHNGMSKHTQMLLDALTQHYAQIDRTLYKMRSTQYAACLSPDGRPRVCLWWRVLVRHWMTVTGSVSQQNKSLSAASTQAAAFGHTLDKSVQNKVCVHVLLLLTSVVNASSSPWPALCSLTFEQPWLTEWGKAEGKCCEIFPGRKEQTSRGLLQKRTPHTGPTLDEYLHLFTSWSITQWVSKLTGNKFNLFWWNSKRMVTRSQKILL